MSRIVSDLIRTRVAPDAITEEAASTLTWLIEDQLSPEAGLDDIDRVVKLARDAYSPLFRKPAPKPLAEPTGPEPLHVRLAREAGKVAPTTRTAADRVSAALAGGNPWQTGNITHQELVGFLDPAVATRLKREAGR